MQRVILICTLLIAAGAAAQDPGRIDQQDMQKMMQQAQKMQACVQKIDQAELEKLRVKADVMAAEIQALCEAGKRDEALSTAIRRGRELQAEPVMREMRECSTMLQDLPAFAWQKFEESDSGSRDICDSM
ncbi:MAG: hypothetical protein QGH46_06580 [Gammaproteobacteria bacterium]|jgi:hypothetical protein|nr:hypothetical protein [Gammaproteobacteria bacterium]MDP7269770.1 hypothetical protein [Gammaproteobacteria bacterium]